ncbi:hypothetical protein FRC09_004949 [Ceratobasidium sp. 395]|nr:hypothetical protein FRC09_004949 [Ceratobasidium sp. 395]
MSDSTHDQKPEDIHKELLQALEQSPELRPLRQAFDGVFDLPEEQVAFASMLQTIRQQPDLDFEKILDRDVPNELKDFVKKYGTLPDPQESPDIESASTLDHAILSDLSPILPFSSKLVKTSVTARKAAESLAVQFSEDKVKQDTPFPPPSVPLPPSPMFHDFAQGLVNKAVPFPEILEGDGEQMKYVPNLPFENWGLTVKNKPSYTFIARTEIGLQNLVKWAGAQTPKKKVRVAGYRHTVSLLLGFECWLLTARFDLVDELQKTSNLVGVEVAPTPLGLHSKTTLCTIKAGTTNEMFRVWCLSNRVWCIPFNVIMVEITFGGSNGPICHGAGFDTTTISDLVAEFHYIDPNGNPKSITDPKQLRAASGCFGLLGICTAVTLRLDQMSMAVMNPVKLPIQLAIPPPPGFEVPSAIDMTGITHEQIEEARQAFIKRCEEDDYLEWFWFPLTSKVWVNTWKKGEISSPYGLYIGSAHAYRI